MSQPPHILWADLFRSPGAPDFTLKFRVLKKSGKPFLLLPLPHGLAAQALALYPAQNPRARLAKSGLRAALALGLPLPLGGGSVAFELAADFPKFLRELAAAKSAPFPQLAILPGNPNTAGRRFILLVFDELGRPAGVVKAGLGEAAQQLVRRERAFLQSHPPGISGLPAVRASFESEKITALALDFVDGEPPVREDREVLGKLLSSWVDQKTEVRAGEIPAWQTLVGTCAANPLFARLAGKLAGGAFHPALFHGDFTPWNIKISRHDGSWQVLDWERGERLGFPAWDWFHYVIQTGILVEKLPANELIAKLEQLLNDSAFQNYAKLARVNGSEKILASAYLFYCVAHIKPAEGWDTAQALLDLTLEKWRCLK